MIKKRFGCFLLTLLLGGCSWLNPFKTEPQKVVIEKGPNPFLWQAAKDKLSGMNLVVEDKDKGVLETAWVKSKNGNEEFKIKIEITSSELRADALNAEVCQKLKNSSENAAESDNLQLNTEVEKIVLNQARVLYRKSLAIN